MWAGVLLIFGLFFFGSGNTGAVINYWESVTAQSTVVLGVINAVCGASAAWESARLRQAAISTWAPARSELRIACEHLAPIALLGLLGVLASLLVFAPAGLLDVPGGPDVTVLGTAYVVILAHIALGWLAGLRVPRLLGPALMLIVGYFWGFWPAAISDPAWLRHLNIQGMTECCSIDQVPSPRSLAATVAFSAGIIVAVLITSTTLRPGSRLLLSLIAFFTGLTVAVTAAMPLEFNGVQPRDRALLHCTGSKPEICLWPEQRPAADDFRRWTAEADNNLRAIGVTPAKKIEFSVVVPERNDVLAATAGSALRLDIPSCAEQPYAEYPGDEAASVIYPWLVLTAGVTPDSLAWPAEAISLAQEVRKMPAASQQAWLDRNMRSVRDCSVKPELSPSAFAQAGKEKR
ncbi:hypothetical protein [Streptomyces sp. NPDC093109]|uniref:DUF7224 domain-containing protein n=1 Tax=Streptomyces sp. NPDC093109 TaxID=3154977 RepID=UPI00344D589B